MEAIWWYLHYEIEAKVELLCSIVGKRLEHIDEVSKLVIVQAWYNMLSRTIPVDHPFTTVPEVFTY